MAENEGQDEAARKRQDELNSLPPELPYELQSKLLDQLATMGIAGAGLVITLRGSILQDASDLVWMAAIEFGLAALVALMAQIQLIEGLFARSLKPRAGRIMTLASVVLIGMGIGALGTSVILEGGARPPSQAKQTNGAVSPAR